MNGTKPLIERSASQQKKAYIKPQVMSIRLVAEEAVLSLCKWNNYNFDACGPDLRCYGASARS